MNFNSLYILSYLDLHQEEKWNSPRKEEENETDGKLKNRSSMGNLYGYSSR